MVSLPHRTEQAIGGAIQKVAPIALHLREETSGAIRRVALIDLSQGRGTRGAIQRVALVTPPERAPHT